MKSLFLYTMFSVNMLLGQTDSINKIGALNDPQAKKETEWADIAIYSEPSDRSKPTLVKAKYHCRDTVFELVYDPSYKGTPIELAEAISAGTLEKYFVIEKDGRLYERIKVTQYEASFFDQYWMYIGIGLAAVVFVYYKLNIQKNTINSEEEENSTLGDTAS